MQTKINELDESVKTLKKDLNLEQTQRKGEDYSLGMRFDTLIHYLQEGKQP